VVVVHKFDSFCILYLDVIYEKIFCTGGESDHVSYGKNEYRMNAEEQEKDIIENAGVRIRKSLIYVFILKILGILFVYHKV